jgi:hypothetical protein
MVLKEYAKNVVCFLCTELKLDVKNVRSYFDLHVS